MVELEINSPLVYVGTEQNQISITGDAPIVYENNYTRLTNKPKINNTELNGNISTDDLGIDYEHLDNKPDLSNYATQSYVDNHHDSTKQDVISDLLTIRSGAALGATSVQSGDNVSDLVNDAGYLTLHQSLANYVTTNTDQTISAKKTLSYTEPIVRGGQETILNVLSTHTSDEMEAMWAGRMKIGNRNKTFLLGVYKQVLLNQPAICGIGAHSWSNSFTEQDAAWEDIYLNPDGDKAVYIGSHDWRANTGWFKVQNNGTDYNGKTYCNRGSIQYPDWQEVATINDNSLYGTNETWSANKINTAIFGAMEASY